MQLDVVFLVSLHKGLFCVFNKVLGLKVVFLFLCCIRLVMDPNQPSNGGDLDDEALWFIFMCMLYRKIKNRQRAIRYDSILSGDDRVTEFLNGHWEWTFNRSHMMRDCFLRFFSILEGTGRLLPSRLVSFLE